MYLKSLWIEINKFISEQKKNTKPDNEKSTYYKKSGKR